MSEYDVISTGARVRRLNRDFRWPGGSNVAMIFNIAFERWSDGKASPLGPMGNPLPTGTFDTNALSWGTYGSVTQLINVAVGDGVVGLWAFAGSDTERQAIRVAAESMERVRSVNDHMYERNLRYGYE